MTLKIQAVDDELAAQYPPLPDNWHTLAQFA